MRALAILGVVTAIGFAGVFLMLERKHRRMGLALILGWLLPGAGHLSLGRPLKAASLFLILATLYVTGLWLSGWHFVSFDDNPFYYVGQFGSGVTTILAQLFGDPKAFPRPDLPPKWIDPAMLYVCVAGLLNVVVTVCVLDAARPTPPTPEGVKA